MKRALSIILALAMLCCVLALSACGNNDTPTTTKGPEPTGSGTEAPTTAPTEEPNLDDWEQVAYKKTSGFRKCRLW